MPLIIFRPSKIHCSRVNVSAGSWCNVRSEHFQDFQSCCGLDISGTALSPSILSMPSDIGPDSFTRSWASEVSRFLHQSLEHCFIGKFHSSWSQDDCPAGSPMTDAHSTIPASGEVNAFFSLAVQ